MATSWTNFDNGDNAGDIRSKINTFNTGISSDVSNAEAAINTNTSNITSLDARVTQNEADIVNTGAAVDNALNKHGIEATIPVVELNVDTTKYDVDAFSFWIDGNRYEYAGATGLDGNFVQAGDFKIIFIDSSGVLQTTTNTFLTPGDLKTKIEIGRIATDDGTNITSIGDSAFLTNDTIKNLYIRFKSFESTAFDGNAGLISEFGTNQLQVAGGFISDPNLNIETIAAETELDVFPVYSIGGVTGIRPLVTDMVVPDTQYDDGTSLTAIPNNKFVAHTLFRSSGTGRYYLEYGRIVYNSLIEADLGVIENNLFSDSGSEVEPLARIIVKENEGIQDIRDARGQPTSTSSEVIATLGWKDNIQPFISAARGGVINEPAWQDIGNGIIMTHWTTGEELPVAFHVDHDYALGTPCFPHIHFFVKNAQSVGNAITWRFEYVIAKGHSQGESLTGPTTAIDMTYVYDGTEVPGEHIVLECDAVDAFDLIEPDTVVLAQVTLLSENVSGDIVGIMSDLHYQSDRETTPFKEPDFLLGP